MLLTWINNEDNNVNGHNMQKGKAQNRTEWRLPMALQCHREQENEGGQGKD